MATIKPVEPAATAAKSEPVKKPFTFPRRRQQQDAEFVRQYWALTADAGTPFERMLAEETYVHLRADMRVGDRIEVREGALNWWGELLVVGLPPKGVAVRLLQHHEWDDIPDGNSFEEKSDFEVIYLGLEEGFVVQRRADKQRMHSKPFATREQAQDYLRRDLLPRASRNKFG